MMAHSIAMDSSQTNASSGVVADGAKSCVGVPNMLRVNVGMSALVDKVKDGLVFLKVGDPLMSLQ
jgi:hypothetical protein